jgi:hypothetical protein
VAAPVPRCASTRRPHRVVRHRPGGDVRGSAGRPPPRPSSRATAPGT